MAEYTCGHCGFEGHCYGAPTGTGVSAPFCYQCGMNNKLTPLKGKTMRDMPEEIWADMQGGKTFWFSAPHEALGNQTHYRLKSLVDAEKAADGKTIRKLVNALSYARDQFLFYERLHTKNDKGDKALTNRKYADVCEQALTDNAPRIAEAQDKKT